MSLSVLGLAYQHVNEGGLARLYGVGTNERYRVEHETDLQNQSIDLAVSSVLLSPSSTADNTMLLFGAPGFPSWWSSPFGDFAGSFVQITNPRGSGHDVAQNVPGWFNDATRSLLLVAANRGTEFRVSFRDIFLNEWTSTIDDQLSGSQATREGDPTLTWMAFPRGVSYLDEHDIYLRVHQPLHISIDWWPDYEASVTYDLALYLDGGGHLQGYVRRWAYWVESGVKSGSIGDRLKPKVIAGMDTLNEKLAQKLGAFSGFAFKGLYYLPGRQLSRAAEGQLSGATTDDVTIVLQTS